MVVIQSNKLSYVSFLPVFVFLNNLAKQKRLKPAKSHKQKVQFGTVEAVINAACACFNGIYWNLQIGEKIK